MAEANETIADIIAEMRRGTRLPGYWRSCDVNAILQCHADRIEAAHRRELSKNTSKNGADFGQLGDAAKLRDALELCMDEMCSRCRELAAARSNPLPCLQGCEPVRKAKAALAAPPRNCDRLNVDDAFEAFTFMCDNTDCRDCPYKQNNKYGDRELCAMLFLYDNGNGGKEGGAK